MLNGYCLVMTGQVNRYQLVRGSASSVTQAGKMDQLSVG